MTWCLPHQRVTQESAKWHGFCLMHHTVIIMRAGYVTCYRVAGGKSVILNLLCKTPDYILANVNYQWKKAMHNSKTVYRLHICYM